MKPTLPIQPYQPATYLDQWSHREQQLQVRTTDEYGIDDRNQTHPTRVIDELLPLQPTTRTNRLSSSMSALPLPSKPLPYEYLPNTSPIKRAYYNQIGQSHLLTTKPKPTPSKHVDEKENVPPGLFAQFVNAMESSQDTPTAPSSTHHTTTKKSHHQPSTTGPTIASTLHQPLPQVPMVSPVGNILFQVRQKKHAREALEASQPPRTNSSDRALTSPIKRRSRTRSTSPNTVNRNETQIERPVRTQSAERSPIKPHPHHAKKDETIDIELLQRYLQPLGLSVEKLNQQLSSKSIQQLAEAVASNSLEPVLPKQANVPTFGRPKSELSHHVNEDVATRTKRRGHFVAHSHKVDEEEKSFEKDHPSIVALRQSKLFALPEAVAAGAKGLPLDMESAKERRSEADLKRDPFQIRPSKVGTEMDEKEGDEVEAKNYPLQQVVPPRLVEILLGQLNDGQPIRVTPTASINTNSMSQGGISPRTLAARSAVAVHYSRAERHGKVVRPEIEQRERARKVKIYDDMIRAENRLKGLAKRTKSQRIKKETESEPSGPKPTPLSTTQLAFHLAAGTKPAEPYSLNGIFCRVVCRQPEVFASIEAAIEREEMKSNPTADSPPAVSSTTSVPLSTSRFSFVTTSDFIEYVLNSPNQTDEWLKFLGFEKEWVEKQVSDGCIFKFVLFQANEIDQVGERSPTLRVTPSTTIDAYRANWSGIFNYALPKLLQVDPTASRASNTTKQAILERFLALRQELTSSSWSHIHDLAIAQGLDHIYEGRPFLTFEEAGESIKQGTFDLVQARRFLNDHLHLTVLYGGDGLTVPQSHSHHEDLPPNPIHKLVFREFLVESCPIEQLPGVKIVDIYNPLGRTGRTKFQTKEEAEIEAQLEWDTLQAQFSMSGQPPPDPTDAIHRSHARSRSRSRSRPRTSAIDTGLKLKPGTDEFAKRQELRDSKRRSQEAAERAKVEGEKEAKWNDVSKRAAERKKRERLAKKRATTAPISQPPTSFTLPTTESKEDDYATDEFHDGSSQLAPPVDSNAALLADILAAAGGSPSTSVATDPKKKKQSSSKKKKKTDPSAPNLPEKSISMKPPLPSFRFPTTSSASASVSSSTTTILAPTPEASSLSSSQPIPIIDPIEAERIRRKDVLHAQLLHRKEQRRRKHIQETMESKRLRMNLRRLHEKCNQLVRPQSATASTSSSKDHSSSSQHRPRSHSRPLSSPARQKRIAEAALDDQVDELIDERFVRAIEQHDLMQFNSIKRKELNKLETKMKQLIKVADNITETSAKNALMIQQGHERNMEEIDQKMGNPRRSRSVTRIPTTSISQLQTTNSFVPSTTTVSLPTRVLATRSLTPSPKEGGELESPDATRAPTTDVQSSLSASTPIPTTHEVDHTDPRLQTVLQLAQQLSTRFSTFLESKLNNESKPIDTNLKQEWLKHAALHPPPSSSIDTQSSTHPSSEQAHADQMQIDSNHARVQSDILQSVTHLQPPYERVVSESELHHPSVVSSTSILLPGDLVQPPFPDEISREPIPHTNVSTHARLFAEHVPSAANFLSSLPASTNPIEQTTPTPLVFSLPPHLRPLNSRPYYDLATREYEALQQRIQLEKQRFKLA